MANYCGRHGCNYADGRSCPECRAEEEAEDRQNTLDALNRIYENQVDSQIDVSELADKINNPGDYDCPECSFRTLQFLARRCPKCHADINHEYWDAVSERRKAQAEKEALFAKERAEKRVQAEREEKTKTEAKAKSELKSLGCFLLVVLLLAGIAAISSSIEDSKTKKSSSSGSSSAPPLFVAPIPGQITGQIRRTESISGQVRTEPSPNVLKQPERFFTLGSTMDEVRLAQGEPNRILNLSLVYTDRPDYIAWIYDQDSGIRFYKGRVENWFSHDGVLKTRIIPNSPVDESLQYFTIGSTKDEVLFVQGQPDSVNPFVQGHIAETDEWTYGPASVIFEKDCVIRWVDFPDRSPLKLKVNPIK